MDRRILFRGKDILTGQWLFGDLLQLRGCVGIVTRIGYNSAKDLRAIDDKTLGNFIGRYDKAGNMIFEHDIVQNPDDTSRKAVVEWFGDLGHDGGAAIHPGFYAKQWMACEDAHDTDFYEIGFANCVVIGNVFDNPELLEKQDE